MPKRKELVKKEKLEDINYLELFDTLCNNLDHEKVMDIFKIYILKYMRSIEYLIKNPDAYENVTEEELEGIKKNDKINFGILLTTYNAMLDYLEEDKDRLAKNKKDFYLDVTKTLMKGCQ